MEIILQFQDNRWESVLDLEKQIRDIISLSMDEVAIENKSVEISIVLCNDEFIRILNKDYLGKDKATNVLSFPQDDDYLLGDIVVSFDMVKKEAKESDKEFIHHFMHMICHGFLHLLGYDHQEEEEAEAMEAIEIKVLRKICIKNPYE